MSSTCGVSSLATSLVGCGFCSTGFSCGSVIVFGRRWTWVTCGLLGVDLLTFLGACSCGAGLLGFIGGSQMTASPDLGGACFSTFLGCNRYAATSSRCSEMVTITPVRFGPRLP